MLLFKKFWMISLVLLFLSNLFARYGVEIEFSSQKLVERSHSLPLKISVSNFSGVPIRQVEVIYRFAGETQFKVLPMKNEGFIYYAQIDFPPNESGMVEYYFGIRYADKRVEHYPSTAPELRLFRTAYKQTLNYSDQIVIISPEPNEQIFSNDIVITASFAGIADKVDPEKTRLYLDTWDLSRYLSKYTDFVTFAPRKVPPGKHKIRLELYDDAGNLVASREWFFTALQNRGIQKLETALNMQGRLFAEARHENLQAGAFRRDYNQAGLQLRGNYQQFKFGGRLYFSNQEKSFRQPVNRYSGYVRMDFWNNRYAKLEYGDAYPTMNPYILQNIFVRGIHGDVHLKFFNMEVISGNTLRAIEGSGSINEFGNPVITRPGTFRRNILAIRPSFGDGQNFQLGFTFLKGTDDTTSIQFGKEPKENAAAGADLYFSLDQQRIVFEGTVNASSFNRNITGGSIPFDSLLAMDPNLDESYRKYYDFQKKFITVNQYLILIPGKAYFGRLRLRYFNNNLNFTYESVDEDYHSLGQPYLLRDNQGFHIADNITLFHNQAFLTVGYRKYHNNLQKTKSGTTNIQSIYANLAYYPLNNLPEILIGFHSYRRKNNIPLDSLESTINRPEDNKTTSINFSTGYQFGFLHLNHHIGINLSNYKRNDIFKYAESNSNNLNLNLKTDFQFPLRTNLEFAMQQTETGKESNRASTISITTYGASVEYTFRELLAHDRLVLRALARLSKVENIYQISQTDVRYNRNYFSFRLNYSVSRFGSLGLLADLINYTGDRNKQDRIFSVRYDLNF